MLNLMRKINNNSNSSSITPNKQSYKYDFTTEKIRRKAQIEIEKAIDNVSNVINNNPLYI